MPPDWLTPRFRVKWHGRSPWVFSSPSNNPWDKDREYINWPSFLSEARRRRASLKKDGFPFTSNPIKQP
jgi:hypothetical protein